jgi:hypothetical protein
MSATASIGEKLAKDFESYCRSVNVYHEKVIATIKEDVINSFWGTVAYVSNNYVKKEFATEAFKEEFLKRDADFWPKTLYDRLNRKESFSILIAYFLLVKYIDDSDIDVIIDCCKAKFQDQTLPRGSSYISTQILRHPECTLNAVKYLANYGFDSVREEALKHKLLIDYQAFL